jgi:hypothetical protein
MRFNGGGNLVEALTEFLSGREYARDDLRGREIGQESANRWTKPSIVVMNQGNCSNADCVAMAYTQLGLGQTVGMPVPGTSRSRRRSRCSWRISGSVRARPGRSFCSSAPARCNLRGAVAYSGA